MDPGPLIASVLTLQATHRSERIWHGTELGPLTCRTHLQGKEGWNVSDIVVNRIRETQFYGIHRLSYVGIDKDLVTALVERWRQETHTFHLPFGEATITLQDVAVLLGLRVGGSAVTGTGNYPWKELVHEYLGVLPDDGSIRGSYLKVTWLRNRFQGLPDDATEDDIVRYTRAYLLYLVGNILLPDKSGSKVNLLYLPLLLNTALADTYSWGSAALACMYRNLCRACKHDCKEIAGPLILLQLWSWERMSMGRPRIVRSHITAQAGVSYYFGSQVEPGEDPLGCRWLRIDREYVDHRLGLVVFRDMLDRMRETDFKWKPYTFEVLSHLPEICHADVEDWVVVTPMICFDMVEWHLPQRCVRQFGWHQTIPPVCDTDVMLHKTDKRQKSNNYSDTYRPYIEMWNNRRGNVVTRGADYLGMMDHFDPYLRWFRQITRRIVSPTNVNLPDAYSERHDYRHTAADMETLALGHAFSYNIASQAIEDADENAPLGYTLALGQLRNLSLESLQGAHFGHLIQVQPDAQENPSPAPRYNLRTARSEQLTPVQEEATPSTSSSRPATRRRRFLRFLT